MYTHAHIHTTVHTTPPHGRPLLTHYPTLPTHNGKEQAREQLLHTACYAHVCTVQAQALLRCHDAAAEFLTSCEVFHNRTVMLSEKRKRE